MKKLIIALLLVPGYAFSMRTSTPSAQSPKDARALREELSTLQSAVTQPQASPAQAQAQLQFISNRLTRLTKDIADAKEAQLGRQSVRSQVQNRRQGIPAQAQNAVRDEYTALEQQLQGLTNQLGSLIERSAKAASRHQARAQQSKLNRESVRHQQQQQQQMATGQAVRPRVSQQVTQRKTTSAAVKSGKSTGSGKTQATPQVYTIDYTKA